MSEIQTKLCLAWFIARDTVPHTTAHRYKNVPSLKLPDSAEADFETLLDKIKGIWAKGDGLEYQQKIREGWV